MSKSSRDSIDGQHIQMKQEIEDENEIDEKKPLPSVSGAVPCTSAIKCEYDPDCGCPPCRFNANTKVKSEEQIKQEIKHEIKLEENYNKVKIETELTRKCIKDEFEDGECGCNECIGVVGSTQSVQVQQEQPQANSPVQEQNEQPTSTAPIDNQDSSDYINDCPTPDYLPPFFSEDEDEEDEDDDEDSANSELDCQAVEDEQNDADNNTNGINLVRSSRTVNKSKQKYQEESSESDNDSDFEPSEDENTNSERSSESNSDEEEVDTEEIHKKERPFKCDHCKRTFLFKQVLRDHKAKVHQIGKCYQYKCKWYKCKYFMNDRRNAMQHIVRAHFKKGDQRDPIDFLHKIAIRESNRKSMIKQDRRKRTIILRLNCPKCLDHFSNKDQLNVHLLRSHQIEKYRCVVRGCSASFQNWPLYHAHKKEVHRNVHVWQCDHCVHETITYEYLLMHTINVHEEGHFRCAVPGCGFLSRTNRYEMRIHHQINHRARKGKSCYRTGLQIFSSDCLGEIEPDCQATEDERIDDDSHTSRLNSGRSSRTVKKSKRKYQKEFSESDNDSDFGPTDDDEEDAEEFTETDSEIGGSSSKESKKPKKAIKSTQKRNKKSYSNESSLDDSTDDDDDGKTLKVTRKNNNQELALRILTLHLNCWKCDGTYKDYKALNKHLRKRHQIRKMRCLVRNCGESFNSGPKLSRHYQRKHSDNNLPCCQCSLKLTNSNKLNYHIWKMHQKGHFKCSHEECRFETHSTRSVVINHYKFEHSDKSTFKCPFKGCGMAFPNQFNLKVHSIVHKKEKSFKCEHCESAYTTSGMLIKHLAREHQIGKMIQYKCEWPKCKSTTTFNCMQNVYAHIRRLHLKDGEKRHPKEFVSKFESNEKPVTKRDKSNKAIVILRLNCPVNRCSKHFPDKDQLNIHLSECHKIEKFRCMARGCSASFQNCLHFTVHKNEVHGKVKIWHCDQCDYKGNTYQLLAQHKGHYHEKGHFACGHRGCKFVSRTYRSEVANHRIKHKKT